MDIKPKWTVVLRLTLERVIFIDSGPLVIGIVFLIIGLMNFWVLYNKSGHVYKLGASQYLNALAEFSFYRIQAAWVL